MSSTMRALLLYFCLSALVPAMAQQGDDGRLGLGYMPPSVDSTEVRQQAERMAPRYLRGPAAQTSYDLRQVDGGVYLPPVRSQGACGSCWAFSSIGALEIWHRVVLGEQWNFSENHLNNNHGFLPDPCQGGNDLMAIAYMSRGDGPVLEDDDPYGTSGQYPGNPDAPVQKLLTDTRALYTMADIKQAVVDYGAVFTTLEWDSDAYDRDNYTFYYQGDRHDSGHGGVIIGWDDNKATQAPNPGAWIIRNSWGAGWGENGYYYISYESDLAVLNTEEECTPAVAFCGSVPADTYSGNYCYTPYGYVDVCGYGNSEGWAASIYTAQTNEMVTAVGLVAPGYNVSYDITLYGSYDWATSTFSDALGASTSGTLQQPGYYTIDLADPISIGGGEDFAVVVHINSPGLTYVIAVERDFLTTLGDSEDLCDASSVAGRSFVSPDGVTFTDSTTLGPDVEVCMRALTVASDAFVQGAIEVSGMPVLAGGNLTLHAPGVGGWLWLRYDEGMATWESVADDAPRLTGQGTATLSFSPVELTDSGRYKCRYDAGMARDLRETEEVTLLVHSPEDFPAAGAWGLGLLLGGCAVVGVMIIMRRR